MSYDLMVFDPEVAPRKRAAFMRWYGEQTAWSEGHAYDDPAVSTPALRAFFLELIETYPAMNGPFAADDMDDPGPRVTDYSIGKAVIYAAFGWSQAQGARATVLRLAEKHRVGFFDASGDDAEIWYPPVAGEEPV